MARVKSSSNESKDNVNSGNASTNRNNSMNVDDNNNSLPNSNIRSNLIQSNDTSIKDNTCSDKNNNNISNTQDNNSSSVAHQNMAIDAAMKRLKDMGWYWGSISPEYAARLLDDEQDGSFLVRDSSSECHIFSMTIKLAGQIHHARIEHSKGQFSFGRGSNPKLVSSTIVDFIEKAIQYSHDGDYSFFLHRDPSMEGPVRFTMIPLSRLKGTNSLKHMCRFAILPYVRRDKISELSIPGCLVDYLNEPFH